GRERAQSAHRDAADGPLTSASTPPFREALRRELLSLAAEDARVRAALAADGSLWEGILFLRHDAPICRPGTCAGRSTTRLIGVACQLSPSARAQEAHSTHRLGEARA